MPDPRDSSSPFGVLDFVAWNHEWNGHHYADRALDQALALYRDLGVGSLRMDFLWSDIEPEKGRWNFARYDRLVEKVRANGQSIHAVLAYAPAWGGTEWNRAPDPQHYATYAGQVVDRYKKQIRHWQIWNEPDHATYWQPQDGLKAYVQLLRTVYPAIKKIDPTSRVHLGGLSQALPRSLQDIYAQGARDSFDIADIHMFLNPLMPDALGGLEFLFQSVRQAMEAAGDGDKSIWLTEFGCPGVGNPNGVKGWWLGKNPSEVHQADWVRQGYARALAWPGVEKVFWAFFRDTHEHFHDGTDYLGLVRNDFSKKPAYDVFRELAHRPR